MKIDKEVVVHDVYEDTYRRGIIVEDGIFLTIEIQGRGVQSRRRRYQYPKRDIQVGEFVVYIKKN